MSGSPSRRPLHERSDSESNSNVLAAIRLVPSTPPQLLGPGPEFGAGAGAGAGSRAGLGPSSSRERDVVYSRTPLPTHPSHFLLAPGKDRDAALAREFRTNPKAHAEATSSGSSVSTTHTTHQSPRIGDSDTGSPISKPKPPSKKRLHIHKDNKTFSLFQDDSQASGSDAVPKSPILALSNKASFDSLGSDGRYATALSNSIESCPPPAPSTPASESKQPISADPISTSPWNYKLVGGLRKVPKTPDLKQKAVGENPLPPLPEVPDVPSPLVVSHDLSAKPSFQSSRTATTTSETTNYKVYGNTFASTSDVALPPPSSSDSNYQLIGPPSVPSTASSVIHRPQTAVSEVISEAIWEDEDEEEFANYKLLGDSSPAVSSASLVHRSKYSQESLVVPPLQPRGRRSNENFGYYKSRSRESLRTGGESFRTGSLTSITTILSQQEASRAIIGSGAIVNLPIQILSRTGLSSWAERSGTHPPRSHMNEHPHQWSSQLSTVLSVSDGGTGTDRGSPSWSDGSRRNSGFPSTASRNSRQMQSISSSLAGEEARSDSLEPPEAAYARGGRRHQSSSSIPVVGDQDEYGDGITDMQDLRARPSRTRLSGFFSGASSDNGRSNTIRSTASSRANTWMIAAFLPLPMNPMSEMRERDPEHSTSNLDSSNNAVNDYTRQFGPTDERRYESAKWWRNLNRWMSVVGVLIIAAVVILVVVSLKEGWTKS
uniref:Serine-rich protein n=1 Tax=Cudoniella acicularis TaxID=354080 RepID=A0A8H4RH05_9HELO